MQLILEPESTLDIHKDMSSIEEPLNEKVVPNGDIDDIKDKKCNGNKENLAEDNIITSAEDIIKVNNIELSESITTKKLTNEDVLLDINNAEALDKNECTKPEESDVDDTYMPMDELNENSLNNDDNTESSASEHVSEVINENVIEDDIISITSEILDGTGKDIANVTENDNSAMKDETYVKEGDDSNVISERITLDSGEEVVNIDDQLETPADITSDDASNILNKTQACDDCTPTLEETNEANKEMEVDKHKTTVEVTGNGICDIPDKSDDVEQSETIDLNDELDVEEVDMELNNATRSITADLNNDQDLSKRIELNETADVSMEDIGQEKTSAMPVDTNVNDVNPDVIIVKDTVDIDEAKDIVKEVNSEICDSNKDLQKVVSPTELNDEICVDDVECITEDPKTNETNNLKLDVSMKESIEVNEEMDVEEIKEVVKENKIESRDVTPLQTSSATPVSSILDKPVICKLSNTLDILSDDDEEPPEKETPVQEVDLQTKEIETTRQQSINIEDDDDIMLIDEDEPVKTDEQEQVVSKDKELPATKIDNNITNEAEETCKLKEDDDLFCSSQEKEAARPDVPTIDSTKDINITEKSIEESPKILKPDVPLVPENFLQSAKKNLADMTREDLEEFCILKIVESIVDRSSLSDIKAKLKTMAQGIEEYRKKAMMLTKQNRDLQVVLKSVQEEQKKMTDLPITPLKITRSVGMQVVMTDKLAARRKGAQAPNNINTNRPNIKPNAGQSPRIQKQSPINQGIPVPRLVPANGPAMKSPSTVPTINSNANNSGKLVIQPVNGVKNLTPPQKAAEKRQHNRIQSVTVDLTDDEPPTKINAKGSPAPPVRVVPPQNLMPPQRQPFTQGGVNNPRKVYIPISAPQGQNIRPAQTLMLKTVPGARPRCLPPQVPRAQTPLRRVTSGRHPAPLPDAMKQYQPPNWKALPPAPDLRLSKVENGIVISWKIEGYQEDSCEEIASYQLYAYQETSSPPSTTLWKKIGDVKALPLPMACTLTQFMAGFKYYFAVRAVDVKSRLGPFSLPGSILLLNKL